MLRKMQTLYYLLQEQVANHEGKTIDIPRNLIDILHLNGHYTLLKTIIKLHDKNGCHNLMMTYANHYTNLQ